MLQVLFESVYSPPEHVQLRLKVSESLVLLVYRVLVLLPQSLQIIIPVREVRGESHKSYDNDKPEITQCLYDYYKDISDIIV